MVVKVTDKEISTKLLKNGGEISSMPYGMVVWSTGIGTRPVIMEFMKQVGQVETQWPMKLLLGFLYCGICWKNVLRHLLVFHGLQFQLKPSGVA